MTTTLEERLSWQMFPREMLFLFIMDLQILQVKVPMSVVNWKEVITNDQALLVFTSRKDVI